MKYTGMEWIVIDTPIQLKEVSAPATPLADKLKLYAKDKSSVSALYYMDDAGVEHDLSGGLTGTGAANKLAIWSAATALTYDTNLHFNSTNDFLGVGTATPLSRIHSVQTGQISGTDHVIFMTSYGVRNILAMTRANGTEAVPTNTAIGDNFFELLGAQYASGAKNSASMEFVSGLLGGGGTISGTSTPSHMRVQLTTDGSTSRSTRFAITPNTGGGLIVLGGGTQVLTANTGIELAPLAGQAPSTIIRGNAYGTSTFMNYQATHARGVAGTPTATQANDVIGRFSALMYGANQYSAAQVASMNFLSGENATNTANGTYITFNTTPLLSVTIAERFRIGPSGQWGIGGATFGGSGDIFSSGGASAAPTWVTRATLNAALDHGTLAGLTDDDHVAYALLAGRSGGQTLYGGTASGNALNLYATSHADGGTVNLNSVTIAGTSPADFSAIKVAPTFSGALTVARGLHILPTFTDTIGTVIGMSFAPVAAPTSGKTITSAIGFAGAYQTGSSSGTVTNGFGGYIDSPGLGTTIPTNSYGLYIANQGASSISNAYGIYITAQSGATNNFGIASEAAVAIVTGGASLPSTPAAALHLISGTDGVSAMQLENTSGGANGVTLTLFANSASPANNDINGSINMYSNDGGGTFRNSTAILGQVTDTTVTSQDSQMLFATQNAVNAGSVNTFATLTNNGVWTDASMARSKKFEGSVLSLWPDFWARLKALRVERYVTPGLTPEKEAKAERHLSCSAEDLDAQFGLGVKLQNPYTKEPLMGIAPKDLAGLALAAVQLLVARVEVLEQQ